MKNFIRNLMLIVFLGTFVLTAVQAQTVVQIGNGTSTTYRNPLNMYYCYSWNRMLYLSSEIGNAASQKKITKIAFQYAYATSTNMTNQTCYMQATSATSLTTGYINPTANGATQVWTGTLSCVQGWVEITLSTPFILPAGSNLQIFWHHNMGTYPGSAYTFYYTSATNMVVDAYDDSSFPSGSSGTLNDIRPNIKITWMPLLRSAAVTEVTSPSRSITWAANVQASAKIANVGLDTITSCRVNWKVNNVLKTPINYVNPLISGATPVTINLGSFTPDSNALNNMTVWVDNALPYDSVRNDDTLSFDFYACTYALNGSYTVGDTNSYFHTLNDALEHLLNCGVSGPTTLLIKNGMYNQAMSLTGSIPGISSTNTVTFASYSGNADSVQIYASGTSILLTQAKYLRFRNLTIGTTSSVGTIGVEFVSGATDIDFYGCNIYAYTAATASTYAPVYYAGSSGSGYQLTDVTFIKNNIMGGYYNMYLYYPGSGSGTNMSSITIDSNTLTEAYYYGIYSYYYGYYPSISYNTINSRTSAGYYYGIYNYYYHTVDTMVSNNIHIYCTSYGYGIYMYYYQNYNSTYNSYAPRYVANNEIFVDAYYTGYGIYGYYYSNLDMYHNSIYVRSRYTASTSYYAYGFYNYTTSTSYKQTIKYNNVRVESYGYAVPIYIPSSTTTYYAPTYIEYDYNNYYATAPTIFYIYSSVSSTLAGWQNAGYNQDANSISILPNYTQLDTSLHTDGFDMLVTTTAKVTKDKDGKNRGVITNMGCYHDFIPNDNDVKMTQIVSPGSSLTAGQSTALKVKITNLGLYNLDSVRIHWVVNGIMDSVNYYCNLAFTAISTDILLDSILPISGINTIIVYTTLPNGVQDEFPSNDTLSINAYGCLASFSGTYVVGPNADFDDLEEVKMALFNCGITGPVVLQFMNGNYSNLYFNQNVPGSSTTNTVTFTSFTGNADSVVFAAAVNDVALTLDGISNLIFRNVTFDAELGTFGVELKNICSDVLFYGCNIKANPTTTSSSYMAVRYNNSSGSGKYLHNVQFIKNNVSGGYYNFYLYYSGSGSTEMGNGSASITIDSNTLTEAYYYGIYSYYYGFYPSISYNTIRSRSTSSTYYGIYTYYYHTIPLMVGNKINIINSSTAYGMYLYYYHNYNTTYGSTGPGLLANNEIIINGAGTKYAMYVYNNSRWDIINNSIYIGPTTGTTYGIYKYTTSTTYMMNVLNNNVFIAATGTTYPIYISSTTYATSSYGVVDYNNYYSNGTYLGYIGSAMTTLTAMKTYQNTNSTNMLPTYINVANSLELLNYSGMLCPQYTGVSMDIRAKIRSTTTYMGCYEPYSVDAALFKHVSTPSGASTGSPIPLYIQLHNLGINTLTSASITLKINNTAFSPMAWTGSIAHGLDSLISLGNYTLSPGLNYIKIWVSNPNLTTDTNTSNDTVSFIIYGCQSALSGTYTVGGNVSDFMDEKEALLALQNCGVSGPVELKFNTGTYDALSFTDTVTGASTTNTITFTSTSDKAEDVSFITKGGVALTLDNTGYFIFKNVTFNGIAGLSGVEFKNICNDILFYGCNILADPTATSSTSRAVSYANTSGSGKYLNNVRFIKNIVSGGYYNFYLYYSGNSGTEMSNGSTSITIDSNILTDAYYYGIYSYYYGYYPSISYNSITSRSTSSSYYGIYTYYYHTIPLMVGNRILVNCSSTGYGMRLYYYHNYNTSYGSNGPGLLANNEIVINNGSSTSYGMYVYNYSRWDIINNSIYTNSTASSYGLYLYSTTATEVLNAKNNNVSMPYATTGYPLYVSIASYSISGYILTDYNNYYNPYYAGYVGSAQTTLAALQTATGQDANSKSINPVFINIAKSLELADTTGLTCARLSNVLTDVTGKSRNANTVMGAYEYASFDMALIDYISPSLGQQVCEGSSLPIRFKAKNAGIEPINLYTRPVELNLRVTGAFTYQQDITITEGSLAPGHIVQGDMEDIPLLDSGICYLTIYISKMDTNTANDTIYTSFYVKPIISTNASIIICQNDLPYYYNGTWLTSAGNYTFTFVAASGCDSIVNLSLAVRPTRITKDTVTICANELPYGYFTSAGTYNVNYTDIYGCDSTLQLTLYVNPVSQGVDSVTICANELPYTYGGNTYYAAGDYDVYFTAYNGCDSIVRLVLHVNPSYASTDVVSLCESEFPLTYGDSTFTSGGVYAVVFTSILGCDSVITLTVIEYPEYANTDTLTICESELPYLYGNMLLTAAGTYNIPFTTRMGCDSLISLCLNVNLTQYENEEVTICDNELPYMYDTISLWNAGVYSYYYTAENGCDSIFTLTLTVNPTYRKEITENICASQLPYTFNDSVLTSGGEYQFDYTSGLGCDSSIVLTLNVFDVPAAPVKIFGDSLISATGTYTYYVEPVAEAEFYDWAILNMYWTGNSSTETIDVNITNEGMGIVRVRAVNQCGFSNAATLTVESNLGINTITSNQCVLGQNIPNPASSYTKIPYAIPEEGTVVFKVLSVNGQVLYNEAIHANSGSHYLDLNTESLSAGIYYYSIEYKGQLLVKKLTIQK